LIVGHRIESAGLLRRVQLYSGGEVRVVRRRAAGSIAGELIGRVEVMPS
jgi:hypothetical protein